MRRVVWIGSAALALAGLALGPWRPSAPWSATGASTAGRTWVGASHATATRAPEERGRAARDGPPRIADL